MKVFKFGGASIKNAAAIRNIVPILLPFSQMPMLVIVSAMAKSTNSLEQMLYLRKQQKNFSETMDGFKKYHREVIADLFEGKDLQPTAEVEALFLHIEQVLSTDLIERDYDRCYSEVVAQGELISSKIISTFLLASELPFSWWDVRECIVTSNRHREGEVDWEWTRILTKEKLMPALNRNNLLTQGFIARAHDGSTTTLGREGSDYSAAILASCIGAESVTIWKDVPGVLNADPNRISGTILLEEISYRDASEMAFFGAKVIHPKTIKPLAQDHIPLLVKSFCRPEAKGTRIHTCSTKLQGPSFMFKENQSLLSIETKDLTFFSAYQLSTLFSALATEGVKINVIQNSATLLFLCIDSTENESITLPDELEASYTTRLRTNLELVTIMNYNLSSMDFFEEIGKDKVWEYRTPTNYHVMFENLSG